MHGFKDRDSRVSSYGAKSSFLYIQTLSEAYKHLAETWRLASTGAQHACTLQY